MFVRKLNFLIYNPKSERDFLVDYLKLNKHNVSETENPDALAGAIIKDNPDVIIVDYTPEFEHLPAYLLDYISENATKAIKVALINSASETDKVRAYELGMDICEALPVNLQELLYRIAVIDKYKTDKEAALAANPPAIIQVKPESMTDAVKLEDTYEGDDLRALGNYTINYSRRLILDNNGRAIYVSAMVFAFMDFVINYPAAFVPRHKVALHLYKKTTPMAYQNVSQLYRKAKVCLANCTYEIRVFHGRGYELALRAEKPTPKKNA